MVPFTDSLGRRTAGARRPLRRLRRPSWISLGTLAVASIVVLPIAVVLSRVTQPSNGVWQHLAETVLAGYVANTLGLLAIAGAVALLFGVPTAWLVTMTRFPGRRVLDWALLLPLAVPAYVMAYVYTDLLQFAGPVQTGLREFFGWRAGDYWFPRIRTLEGAGVMLGAVLYPYVYLLARSAFVVQSSCLLDAGRTLGCGPWRSFWRIGLPLARPAIIGGLLLVMMETIADYGTVQYFGVPTFTTGIYRAWFGMGEPVAAAQLSVCLLVMVAVLLVLERQSRGQARYHHTGGHYRRPAPPRLDGLAGWGATAACLLPILIGFLVPAGHLLSLTLDGGDPLWGRRFKPFAVNTLILASVTAVLATALAVLLAYGTRLSRNRLTWAATRLATTGYALPGSVIAVGVLIPFAAFDNQLDAFLTRTVGVSTGLLLTGSIAALVFAYLVRFLAVSFNAVDAGFSRVSPNLDAAARSLGHGPGATLVRVHAPLVRGGLLTAALLVFVDVMKELPATLIMRPFNFDTLALRVYQLASDERLAEASTAALTIVAVGVLPIILLSRGIARSRPGEPAGRRWVPAAGPAE